MSTKGLMPGQEEAVWAWKRGAGHGGSSVVIEMDQRMKDIVRRN